MSRKVLHCALLWVGIVAFSYSLHAMESHLPFGESEVRKHLFGQDISWTPSFATQVDQGAVSPVPPLVTLQETEDCNQFVIDCMLKEAAGGTPIVLFCGLNRRTPQEGAGFISPPGVVTVTFSLDPLSKQVVQDVLDRKILHLSGSWMDPTLMGRIPAILWAILFDANAVQYLNRLALQLLTSKLAPGGYLFLPIINLYSAGGQVRDSRFQFAYEQKDGPWDGICYSPPDSLCDVLREELRSEQLTLTIRMVRRDPPEPQNEACAKFLQTRCQGCGIRFVHHRQKAASIAFMLEFRTFSGEYCTFAKAGAPTKEGEGAPTRTRAGIPIRKDILQFYENPVAVIHRKSLED